MPIATDIHPKTFTPPNSGVASPLLHGNEMGSKWYTCIHGNTDGDGRYIHQVVISGRNYMLHKHLRREIISVAALLSSLAKSLIKQSRIWKQNG
jgi:hypothetical protein